MLNSMRICPVVEIAAGAVMVAVVLAGAVLVAAGAVMVGVVLAGAGPVLVVGLLVTGLILQPVAGDVAATPRRQGAAVTELLLGVGAVELFGATMLSGVLGSGPVGAMRGVVGLASRVFVPVAFVA